MGLSSIIYWLHHWTVLWLWANDLIAQGLHFLYLQNRNSKSTSDPEYLYRLEVRKHFRKWLVYGPAIKCYYKIQMPFMILIYHIIFALLIPQNRIGDINNNLGESKAWSQRGYGIKCRHTNLLPHGIIIKSLMSSSYYSGLHQSFLNYLLKYSFLLGTEFGEVGGEIQRWIKKQTFLCQVAHSKMYKFVFIISITQKSDITVLRPCFK